MPLKGVVHENATETLCAIRTLHTTVQGPVQRSWRQTLPGLPAGSQLIGRCDVEVVLFAYLEHVHLDRADFERS